MNTPKRKRRKKEMIMQTNSNPNNLPLILARETFGIIDPATGQRYEDIKKAYLHAKEVTAEELKQSEICKAPNGILYKIQIDKETWQKIMKDGAAYCVISFQQRTYGNFALIRLFKKELRK